MNQAQKPYWVEAAALGKGWSERSSSKGFSQERGS